MFTTEEFVPKMFSKNQPDHCHWAPALSSLSKCSWRVWCVLYVCNVRCGRIHHSGGSGDDLSHRKTAEETLRHRLPGVWTQHYTGFHQTGELKLNFSHHYSSLSASVKFTPSSLNRNTQNTPFTRSFIWWWGGVSCSTACRGRFFTESSRAMMLCLLHAWSCQQSRTSDLNTSPQKWYTIQIYCT